MEVRGAAVGTVRHVTLVALEALLVAALVWIAAMALAGMSQADAGVAGTANAGPGAASVTVADGRFGGTTVATVSPGSDRSWVHATCTQGATVAGSQWVRVDARGRATLTLGPTATWQRGGASCTVESGYFANNGRWRVQSTTTFAVAP